MVQLIQASFIQRLRINEIISFQGKTSTLMNILPSIRAKTNSRKEYEFSISVSQNKNII